MTASDRPTGLGPFHAPTTTGLCTEGEGGGGLHPASEAPSRSTTAILAAWPSRMWRLPAASKSTSAICPKVSHSSPRTDPTRHNSSKSADRMRSSTGNSITSWATSGPAVGTSAVMHAAAPTRIPSMLCFIATPIPWYVHVLRSRPPTRRPLRHSVLRKRNRSLHSP